MNPLIGTSLTAAYLLLASFALCAGGQVVHGYLRIAHNKPGSRGLVIAYEAAMLVHLLLMSSLVFSGLQGQSSLRLQLLGASVPFAPLLWANAAVVGIAAYTAIAGIEDPEATSALEDPNWMPPIEAALACGSLPAVMELAGGDWAYFLYVDGIYFLFRTSVLLLIDLRMRSHVVSRLSVTEALKALPEGMLYADEQGRTLVANDAMRHCLSALGLPTDFAHVDELWMLLGDKARGSHAVDEIRGLQREGEPWLFIRIGDGEVRLFSFEGGDFDGDLRYPSSRALDENPAYLYTAKRLLGSQPNMRIFAYDVTQEVEMMGAIEAASAELAEQQSELQASMETVREAAENEALLRMRGRVHDVIGQRLSLLHRALEDDAVSDDQLERLKPLLKGILDDLAAETVTSPSDELDATIAAFALTGVGIDVRGELPEDPVRAKVYADCVREAATNAVKHARSTEVTVRIAPDELVISNDGPLPALPIREGTGMATMRRAAESIGAKLVVEALEPPFTVRIA